MPHIVRVGDKTLNRGCTVTTSGAPQFTLDGRAVALQGDALSCGCTIIEGDAKHPVCGVPVALDGYRTSCGDRLCASTQRYCKD